MMPSRKTLLQALIATALGATLPYPASAQQTRAATNAPAAAPAAAPAPRPGALGNIGANSKDPIKIDSDRLDVFEREGRAVFTGNVVAVQGESTIRCSVLTVTYESSRGPPGAPRQPPSAPAASGNGDNAIKHLDCKGPVTVSSKTQTATGENAAFDRTTNKVVMTGNVALSDGPNVTRGDRIVYDMATGVANVETQGGRVRALITPGSGNSGGGDGGSPAQGTKPKASPRPGSSN